jgi:hypothetical protein
MLDLLLVQAVAAFARHRCPAFMVVHTRGARLSVRCISSSQMTPTAIKLLLYGRAVARSNVTSGCWHIPLFYENRKKSKLLECR